ncbi:glucan endo-1,3-beta-D-glucosidase-like [Arachis hypogaea]|uniref:glucan endo-1,3-beta-D-glucosidase-like n=1 Tax=Arachis hypogaea TaxID=3818 RepID=UPI000DEC09D8|nr:uncharacterized protein LOC112795423 [Arachis hypogaea]
MKLTFSNISSDEAPVMVRIGVMPDSSSEKEAKKGLGNLLMLAHPLHLQLLSKDEGNVTVLKHFKYRSIDGGLVGVVGDSWMLEAEHVPVSWHSTRGVNQDSYDEIKQALCRDVGALCSSKIANTSSACYGKSIARAARLAGIAEEQWGGLINKLGSDDDIEENLFGFYNNCHSLLGYFVYGIAVLAKIDPNWDSDVGRYQYNSGEAVNAIYSAALMGLAYNDANLVAIGSTLAALEIHAAQMWCHLKMDDRKCSDEFTMENRFAPWEEHRLAAHVLPLLPITEFLFSNVGFVKEVVEWTMPCLNRDGVGEILKGLVYAREGIYDNEAALKKVGELPSFDSPRSTLSDLLWWLHSRRGQEDHHQDSCYSNFKL